MADGSKDGLEDGADDGSSDGTEDGVAEGETLGVLDGAADGFTDGVMVAHFPMVQQSVEVRCRSDGQTVEPIRAALVPLTVYLTVMFRPRSKHFACSFVAFSLTVAQLPKRSFQEANCCLHRHRC